MPPLQDLVNQYTGGSSGGQSKLSDAQSRIPTASEPLVISSDQGKTVVDNATEKLNTLEGVGLEPVEPEKEPVVTTSTPEGASGNANVTKDFVTYVNPETGQESTLRGDALTEENKKKMKEQGYTESLSDVSTSTANKEKQIADEARKRAEETLNGAMAKLESSAITSKELREQTRNIRRVYSARMKEMEQINARRQQTFNTLGIRLGSRFTGGSAGTFGSIIAEEERQGLNRISAIQNEMLKAISDAKRAAKEQNYGVYVKMTELAQKKYDEKVKAFADLEKAQKETDELLKQEKETIDNQADVIEQVQLGIKDPIEIFTALGGKVPFDVIKELTDTLPKPAEQEQFTLGKDEIRFDATGKVIARGSNAGSGGGSGGGGGSLGAIMPVGTPVVAGVGSTYSNSSFEAQMMIDDILNKVPAQLRNTEKETELKKEQIRKQLAAGYSYQDIVDRLSGFSLQGTADKALGSALYNASLGTDLDVGQLASLINRGANEEAVAVVENKKLNDVKLFFASPDEASAYVNATNEALKLLSQKDFPTKWLGSFDGRVFKATRFLGADATDAERKKLQQLETQLAIINAPIRVSVAGTAATPAEMDKITGFQADIRDNPGTIKTILEQMQNSILTFHNSARSQRGLPTVNATQLVDPKARVELYRSIPTQEKVQSYSNASNAELLGTVTPVSRDPNGIY